MNEEPVVIPSRRWPGVLLSLLVPGFGLVRAGLPFRGLAWFAAMFLSCLLMVAGAALSVVPVWGVVGLWLGAMAASIWMLCDSFRPGKMTLPLWLLFASVLAILMIVPQPIYVVAKAFKIPAGSMEPTLRGAKANSTPDFVIVDRLSYRFSPPRRGDLIVFSAAKVPGLASTYQGEREIFFTKRLVGLPGERIRIAGGKVYAGGRQLGELDGIPPFAYTESLRGPSLAKSDDEEFIVSPGEYFVLGDNSPNSYDSRYWGCVPASAVFGKVTMIYYPFSRMRRISSP